MKRLTLFLAVLLCASQANAIDGWFKRSDCTGQAATEIITIKAAYFCADSSPATTFSSVLRIEGATFNVIRYGDNDGSPATSPAGKVKVWSIDGLAGTAVSASTGLTQIKAFDPEGGSYVTTLDGTDAGHAIYEASALGITIEVTTNPGSNEQMVIAVIRE